METTKKLNETPLIQEMTADHTYVIVDSQGNVSRMNDVPKKYVTETELTDFIKPYDERITANQTDISDTKTDVLDVESYIDTITPKNTASGEIVHITDALNLPTFETTADGNVEQETTSGYNILNFKVTQTTSLGVVLNEDGTITLNGTSQGTQIKFENITLIANKTYKAKAILVSGSVTNPTNNYGFRSPIGDNHLMNNDNFTTHTPTEDLERFTIWVDQNSAYDNATFKIYAYEGTEEKPWEKFTNGASPNPNYKQPIKVLEGYNKFDSKKSVKGLLNVENGELFTDSNSYNTSDYIKVDKDIKNYISCKLGNATQLIFHYYICLYNENKEFISNISPTISMDKVSFTTNQNGYVRFSYYNNDEKYANIQFSYVNKPYLPYGCVGVKVNRNNILNFNVSQILNVTNNSDGTITLNGKGNDNLWYSLINFKANKKYYIKVELVSGEITGIDNSGIMDPTGAVFLPLNKFREFSFAKDTTKQTIRTHAQAVYNNARLKIWISDEQTDFEPYQEQIVYLDLKGNWVGKINDNIKDYLVTDKKKYWLVKNVGKVVLDGSEDWTYSLNADNTTYRFSSGNIDYKIDKDYGGPPDFLNTHFLLSGFEQAYYGGIECMSWWFNETRKVIIIYFGDNRSLEECKQWLNENNVTLYFPLAKPYIEDLGELPEPIKTFEGVNNIQLLANLDTEIEVVYAQDVKKYIDSKLAEISAQII